MLCRKRLANRVTKIFEGEFNLRTIIPDVILLKGCNSSRYHLSETFTAHKIYVVIKVISCSWTFFMNLQVTQSAWNGVRSNTKVIYNIRILWITLWNFVISFALETMILVLLTFTWKPCDLSEVLQAATYF